MKRILRRALARLGYRLQGTRFIPRQFLDSSAVRHLEVDDVICRRMVEVGPMLTFLQVGAFDGRTADPLYRYIAGHGWRGVVVEPQPAAADRLRSLYRGNPRVEVVEAAIDHAPGRLRLYTVLAGDGVPAWVGGLASFDRDNVMKHAAQIPDLESLVQAIDVPCLSFEQVLAKLPGELDLLQTDVEGADDTLLGLFPFERARPAIVHFEIKHLSTARREACFDRLLRFGYRIAPAGDENALGVLVQARDTR